MDCLDNLHPGPDLSAIVPRLSRVNPFVRATTVPEAGAVYYFEAASTLP